MNRLRILAEALHQWICPACGGSKTYLNKSVVDGEFVEELVPCKKCSGTGLHPIATEALERAEA